MLRAFAILLDPAVTTASLRLMEQMQTEDGVNSAVRIFYKHLPLSSMVCDVSLYNGESRLAHVYCRTCKLKMCREVSKIVHSKDGPHDHVIVPCAYAKWGVQQPTDTVTGLFQGLGAVSHELAGGMVDVVYHPISAVYAEGIGGLASGLVTGLKCLLYRPYMGGIVLAQKMKQGWAGLTSDQGDVLEKSRSQIRNHKESSRHTDDSEALPFTLNVNDTCDTSTVPNEVCFMLIVLFPQYCIISLYRRMVLILRCCSVTMCHIGNS